MAGLEDFLEDKQKEEQDTDKTDTAEPMTSHLLKGTSDVHVTQSEDIAAEEHVAEPEIDIMDSKEPMGPHVLVGTSDIPFPQQKNIVQEEQDVQPEVDILSSKELEPQNLVKLLHLGHQLLLILAFVTCVIIQYPFGSQGMVVGLVSTRTGMLMLAMVLDLIIVLLYSRWSIFGDLKTYWRTVALVLQDYVLLIMLNRKYIEIAIIPFTFVAFMYALASNDKKNQREDVALKEMATIRYLLQLPLVVWSQIVTLWKGLTESAKELMIMSAVPYLLQLGLVVWTQYIYMGQVAEGHVFTFSSFLLFLCSALSALTVMIASSPPIGVSDGVDQVLPVMHKTCMVMLVLTAHSMAAEWLGEDIVLACMPELISVLAWFTIYCHHPEHEVIINAITSHGSLVIVVSSVVAILECLTSMYADKRIILRSWFLWMFYISSSSSALSRLDVWLLDRWPDGSTPNSSGGLVQLLKFFLAIGTCVSALMLSAAFPQYRREAFKYIASAEEYFWSIGSLFSRLSALTILAVLLAILVFQQKVEKKAREIIKGMLEFVLHMATLLFQLITRRKEHRMGMQEAALYNGANAAATTAPDRHINQDELSTQYPDDYDTTTKFADEFYKDQSSVPKDWNDAAPTVKPQLTGLYEKDQRVKCLEETLSGAGSNRTEVVCIFGVAGGGKKKLALEVYQRIKGKFDYHLLVSVGQDPAMAKLVKDMTEQVLRCSEEEKKRKQVLHCSEEEKNREQVLPCSEEEITREQVLPYSEEDEMMEQALNSLAEVVRLEKENMTEQALRREKDVVKEQTDREHTEAGGADNVYQLAETLRTLLDKKRYLVVLNDIRSNNDWKTIESCFPQDDTSSRIIITTESEDVAKAAGDHFYWIPVPARAEVESLFSRKFSESSSGVFASRSKRKEDSFERSGLQWKELEQMKQLITVRYNGLSAHLRACLLYLSLFPENHEVEIKFLVRLWVQGWVISGHVAPFTEETARSYIDELIARKLIEKSSHDHEGNLRSCTVHPLIHEFIVCQARENGFVGTMKSSATLPIITHYYMEITATEITATEITATEITASTWRESIFRYSEFLRIQLRPP